MMNGIAFQIEAVALDFGRRFSQQEPNPPISCTTRLRELTISAAIGSGVRYEVAEGIAKAVVSQPTQEVIYAEASRHRFPNQTRGRLKKLLADGAVVLETAIEFLMNPTCVHAARIQLSDTVPGLGPKQSSFLLSICGYGQSIAVLDRHIVKFLGLIGIVDFIQAPSSWVRYQDMEMLFLRYSREKNIRPDALDIAIWLTMKAAGRKVS